MKSIFIFVILCACISTALSIICYDCQSDSDPHCNQHFEPEGVKLTNCDEATMPELLNKPDYEKRLLEATGCLTKVYKEFKGPNFYIRRGCYFGDPENTSETCNAFDPYVPWGQLLVLLACNVCTEDKCNGVDAFSGAPHTVSVGSKLTLFGVILIILSLKYII